jgi:AbrB family looped-hinge helix DNA binding protein
LTLIGPNAISFGMGQSKSKKAKRATPAGFGEGEHAFQGQEAGAAPASKVARVEMGAGGRLVIPVAMRAALGMKPGDTLTVRLEDDELRVHTSGVALRRIQERLRKLDPEGRDGVDAFLAERRRAAAKEAEEFGDD